jgi:hypothetical protein
VVDRSIAATFPAVLWIPVGYVFVPRFNERGRSATARIRELEPAAVDAGALSVDHQNHD